MSGKYNFDIKFGVVEKEENKEQLFDMRLYTEKDLQFDEGCVYIELLIIRHQKNTNIYPVYS
jgi:hypothetical protein